jgi:hypothetical protein
MADAATQAAQGDTMGLNHINRRTFGAGLAVGIPAALAGTSTFAQTPVVSGDELGRNDAVLAKPPDALLALLLEKPFNSPYGFFGAEFDATEWQDLAEHQYSGSAVGGVLLERSDGGGDSREQTLGGYLVYSAVESATSGLAMLEESTRSEGDVLPLAFAGAEGFTGVAKEDAYASSYLRVGNVIVLASDMFLADGARSNRASVVFQSTVYAVVMVEHLARITRPEDA